MPDSGILCRGERPGRRGAGVGSLRFVNLRWPSVPGGRGVGTQILGLVGAHVRVKGDEGLRRVSRVVFASYKYLTESEYAFHSGVLRCKCRQWWRLEE